MEGYRRGNWWREIVDALVEGFGGGIYLMEGFDGGFCWREMVDALVEGCGGGIWWRD